MKIVHVIDYFQPKLGYQETYLAREQTKAGHDVTVITSDRYAPILYPSAFRILGPRIKIPGHFKEEAIDVIRLPTSLEIVGRIWLQDLMRTIIQLKPDLVIIHSFVSFATIQMLNLKKKLPSVSIVIDDHMVQSATRLKMKLFYMLFRVLFTRRIIEVADALVATHENTMHFMNQMYGIPQSRIQFIPLGCDTTLFQRNADERKTFRLTHGFKGDSVLFIYAGKLIASKGPHILIDAAISLMNRYQNVSVILVGNGSKDYVKFLIRKIENSGFGDRFLLRNLVPHNELFKIYSAADVGVWPLQCSLTMIEAMSCHLPVIISDNSGVTNRVSHDNGYLYREGIIEDLTQRMELLLNSDRREEMGRNARKFAEMVDWSKISMRFSKLK